MKSVFRYSGVQVFGFGPFRPVRVGGLRAFPSPRLQSPGTCGFLIAVCIALSLPAQAEQIAVGSKKFTESYVLGEIAKRVLERAGFQVVHKQGMGGTIILWNALKGGEIAAYPEYTGTISEEILKMKGRVPPETLRAELGKQGIGMTDDLGFNDTYAFVMRANQARQLGIRTISDLKKHPELRVGLDHEFLKRQDGWDAVRARYGLEMPNLKGIDHGLIYTALGSNAIDVTDVYSTDAKIGEMHLYTLQDDLGFFPQYKAVFLYRQDTPAKAVQVLRSLEGTIDEAKMIRLNAEAERTKNYAEAASLYFGKEEHETRSARWRRIAGEIGADMARHLELVAISLALAIIFGVPLGIIASRPGLGSETILGATGIVQTIPSLALLALLVSIPGFGIGTQTAVLALFLYSLLPIVRNTATGLQEIPGPLRESAAALGLEPGAQLLKVFLPMASRTILAGIKTSAIINVGTATLAALIGAGGLGRPILSGLNLNDSATILQGAIPAAVLALLVQLLFNGLDRLLIPRGLRLRG